MTLDGAAKRLLCGPGDEDLTQNPSRYRCSYSMRHLGFVLIKVLLCSSVSLNEIGSHSNICLSLFGNNS